MSRMAVVVVFLIILSTNRAAQANVDCTSVVNKILSCKNYVENPTTTPISPGTQYCCDALRNIMNADSDAGKCLKQSPLGSAFLPSRARGICNLPGLSSLVNSIDPAAETDSQTSRFWSRPGKGNPLPRPGPPSGGRFKIPPFVALPDLPFPFLQPQPLTPPPPTPQLPVSPPFDEEKEIVNAFGNE